MIAPVLAAMKGWKVVQFLFRSPWLVTGVLGLAIGTATTYKLMSWSHDATRIAAVERALEQAEKLRETENELTVAHYESLLKTSKEIQTITNEVPVYVPVNPTCDLTRGAVGLLNHATTGMPDPAVLDAGEKEAYSTVTQQAQIKHTIEYAKDCRELEARHNALIDWHLAQKNGRR